MKKTFHADNPIVLGLCGEMGAGKTSTAMRIATPTKMSLSDGEGTISRQEPIHWEHLYFALPLYRMATALQNIEGEEVFSRQCYEIHDALLDVFGRSLEYDELVDTVYEVVNYPCPKEGKPRGFLQYVGTEVCRRLDPECWVKWMKYKIQNDYLAYQREQFRAEELWELEYPDYPFVSQPWAVVVSDVRFLNEAELIASQPNGYLVKLVCDPEVRRERIRERDNDPFLELTQSSHASEAGVDLIPLELFDLVIDNTSMLFNDQVAAILNLLEGD